jgi:hypothetical protein
MSDDGGSVIDQQFVELPIVIPDGLRLVRSTCDYSPWVLVDEYLVKSLGLTNAYDTPQSYIQLHLFLSSFLGTSIIYSIIFSCMGHGELLGRDRLTGDISLYAAR